MAATNDDDHNGVDMKIMIILKWCWRLKHGDDEEKCK